MKRLKTFDRIMAVILLVLTILSALLAIALAWNISPFLAIPFADELKNVLTSGPLMSILITLLSAFIIFVCIRILFVRQRSKQASQQEQVQNGVMLRNGEYGASYITQGAIQYLVDKHVRSMQDIRDSQSVITITPENNLRVQVKISAIADGSIPEITSQLQESLKKYIESVTGIALEAVEVLVAAPATTEAANKGAFESRVK